LREIIKRSLSGTVFVVLMLGGILWNPYSLLLLLTAISSIALFEYYRIFQGKGYTPLVKGGIASGILILAFVTLVKQNVISSKYLELVMVPVIAMWFSFIFVKREELIQSLMITVTGLIYILLPLTLMPFIAQNKLTGFEYNPEILIGTLLIVWTYDSFAYLSGILLGKHKMAPNISPKKSWEGFFGGMIFAIAAGAIYARFTHLLNVTDWIILSFIIVLSGTAGDLFESLIKREGGVKDSGKIMPGHGGILDRFDSLLLIIPFVFLYLYLIKI
jgi:phosphatidate cytidylyltransferase